MKNLWMQRCLQLAEKGLGRVAPNPLVGCVIVYNDKIIGEGYHQKIGESHAEVNAINSVKDPNLLKESTLYVNLEPCAHYGLTPPCANLIVEKAIPHVVIANADPFAEVNGKGIAILKAAGVKVEIGIEAETGRWLNRRFFTFHEKKRPYVILKFARSQDGFMDAQRKPGESGVRWISAPESQRITHLWRSREDAILIGTQTAIIDNPSLNTRAVSGKNPLRLVIDRGLKIPESNRIFADGEPIVVFNAKRNETNGHQKFVELDFEESVLPQILDWCFQNKIQSLIIEGGTFTTQQFINANLWDEARIITGLVQLNGGLKAPYIIGTTFGSFKSGTDTITLLKNTL
jgi:diaminohydroxyphosphoribosylaminopyrimidine deaminase / 5-amino-6-(5-phosphoribosylamino)uracil reductase